MWNPVIRTFWFCVLFSFLLLPSVGAAQTQPQNDTMIIEGGTLIDGTGAPPRRIAAIIISGNRIREIVPEGRTIQAAGPAAERVRADGLTILPGYIDSHVHYQGWDAELYISHGITSVLDMGNVQEWILA